MSFFYNVLKYPRQGYNTENILKNAPKEFNETLGEDTFLVPLVKVSEREVHQLCEEEVVQAELALQKRKVKDNDQKAKSDASGSKVFVPVDLVSESDEETKPLAEVLFLKTSRRLRSRRQPDSKRKPRQLNVLRRQQLRRPRRSRQRQMLSL